MPEIIQSYSNECSYRETDLKKQSIIETYKDDFAKYKSKIDYLLMTNIFNKLPMTVGKKVKYSNINKNERSKKVADILHLFELARIIYKVRHSASNGLPLGAEVKENNFKNIFLDVGLMLSIQGLNYLDIDSMDEYALINTGNISEQFVGQHLLYSMEPFIRPELYYWNREKINSSSEIDFIITHKTKIIPIEVKSGKKGSLKSLHRFVYDKNLKFAVRINSNEPIIEHVSNKLTTGENVSFKMLSVPFYLVYRLRELLDSTV